MSGVCSAGAHQCACEGREGGQMPSSDHKETEGGTSPLRVRGGRSDAGSSRDEDRKQPSRTVAMAKDLAKSRESRLEGTSKARSKSAPGSSKNGSHSPNGIHINII